MKPKTMWILIIGLYLLSLVTYLQGQDIPAPDPVTVPATEEKVYNHRAVVRIEYASPDGKPGRFFAHLRLADLISPAEGYDLHPDEEKKGDVRVESIVVEAQRNPRFRDAMKELFKTLGFMAEEQRYAKIPEADRTPQQVARLAAARTALGITP
jgi:hypothetical protein